MFTVYIPRVCMNIYIQDLKILPTVISKINKYKVRQT